MTNQSLIDDNPEARAQRASDQGFHPQTWYHATSADITAAEGGSISTPIGNTGISIDPSKAARTALLVAKNTGRLHFDAGGQALKQAINNFSQARNAEFDGSRAPASADTKLLQAMLWPQQHQLAVAEVPQQRPQPMAQNMGDLGDEIERGAKFLKGEPADDDNAPVKGAPNKQAVVNAATGHQTGNAPSAYEPGDSGASNDSSSSVDPGLIDRTKYGLAGVETPGITNPYLALGRVLKNGDRAYGKYQVMASNVPSWTQEALGTAMTPEQFRQNPEAQEKTVSYQLGKILNENGKDPRQAASIWFTGKRLENVDPNVSDGITTNAQYQNKFMRGFNSFPRQAAAQSPQPNNPYANIPDVDSEGRPGQVSKFMRWNPDPVGNSNLLLSTVHPDMQAVVRRAQAENPNLNFITALGKSSPEQGAQALKWGWAANAGGDAPHQAGTTVDLWPVDQNGRVNFDLGQQRKINAAMQKAAGELGFNVRWGGLQSEGGANKNFADRPNFQLLDPRPLTPQETDAQNSAFNNAQNIWRNGGQTNDAMSNAPQQPAPAPRPQAPQQPQQSQAFVPTPSLNQQQMDTSPQAMADPMSDMYDRLAFSPDVQAGYDNPQVMFDPNSAPSAARGGKIRRASGGPAYASMPTNELIDKALNIIRRRRAASGGSQSSSWGSQPDINNPNLTNSQAMQNMQQQARDLALGEQISGNANGYNGPGSTFGANGPQRALDIASQLDSLNTTPQTGPTTASAPSTPNNTPAVAAGTIGNQGTPNGAPLGAPPSTGPTSYSPPQAGVTGPTSPIPMASPTGFNGYNYNNSLDEVLGTNAPTSNQIFGFDYPQNLPAPKPQPVGPVSQDEINALYGYGGGVNGQMGTGTYNSGGAVLMDALNRARKARRGGGRLSANDMAALMQNLPNDDGSHPGYYNDGAKNAADYTPVPSDSRIGGYDRLFNNPPQPDADWSARDSDYRSYPILNQQAIRRGGAVKGKR